MKSLYLFLFITFFSFGQTGFQIEGNKNKVVIPFQIINNLPFISINVNGEQLTFLLDTGVEETVLFSLEDKNEVSFFNVKKIKLKGLGGSEAIEALKSSNNKLQIKGYSDFNHEIYIVLDQDFNFSSQVGIPVNGIIGYHFFKNYKVEINYSLKKIYIYRETTKLHKRISKKYFADSISLENRKPYLTTSITSDQKSIPSKVLLDTGNSDALWIFSNIEKEIKLPTVTVSDYLGRGFSGNVYGLRGRISNFTFGNHKFENPIATFPDSLSIKDVVLVKNRVGSIGSEVFKRFSIIFDYPKNKLYTKPNEYLTEPFNYNMSGIEIQHDGLEWIQGGYIENPTLSENILDGNGNKVANNLKFKFELKPIFKISSVRVGSTAADSGLLKGDKILKINKNFVHRYKMEDINKMLKSDVGRVIEMEVEREGKIIKVKFQLKVVI